MYGPPGVGKTEVVLRVAEYASQRVVLNKITQLYYVPLKVGPAPVTGRRAFTTIWVRTCVGVQEATPV